MKNKDYKAIVKTSGQFSLYDMPENIYITKSRPHVVKLTSFVNQKIFSGELELLASKVPFEASDEEFKKYFDESEGDVELAVEAFMSQYNLDAFGKPLLPELDNTVIIENKK